MTSEVKPVYPVCHNLFNVSGFLKYHKIYIFSMQLNHLKFNVAFQIMYEPHMVLTYRRSLIGPWLTSVDDIILFHNSNLSLTFKFFIWWQQHILMVLYVSNNTIRIALHSRFRIVLRFITASSLHSSCIYAEAMDCSRSA